MADKIAWQAKHDYLTGLVNRAEFEHRVTVALHGAKNEGQVHALLYMDLDRFKVVNDTCGHAAGDLLLKRLCDLLHSRMREIDVLARVGGDELGALLLNCPPDKALLIAEDLRSTVRSFKFLWEDRAFDIGISIGLAAISQESMSTTDVLVAADQACYIAKDKGRNRVHVHQENDAILSRKRGELRWLARLQEAFEHDRFRLAAMPIVNLYDKEESHFEVLVRMVAKSGELILPGAFIPTAERYDMMIQVDRWVIKTLFAFLAKQQLSTAGASSDQFKSPRPIMYAVNLSGASLGTPQFSDYVTEQFREHSINPEQICFEITETAVISNFGEATGFMKKMKNFGCLFSLDDFGSGLSSFGYLKSLPVDYLKVDGLFIRDLITNHVNQALVRAINQVGHTLGLKTVAEYVADAETLGLVRAIGLDYAQGHALGVPTSLGDSKSGQEHDSPRCDIDDASS